MTTSKTIKLSIVATLTIAVIILIFTSFTVVNEGFIGVKYQFGKITDSQMTAGLYFKLPFAENIQQIDIRNQIYAVEADAYTSDTQTVDQLRLKVNYYYDSSKISNLIRDIGISNIETKLLVPNVAKIAKNEIGKVKAEVLVQSRATIQTSIQEALYTALSPYGIIISEFAIENLSFDAAFETAIQAKVIAEQEVLTIQSQTKQRAEENTQKVNQAIADAEILLKKSESEAKTIELKSEAEAQAIKLIQEQLTENPEYIKYLQITNWDGSLPQVVGENNPFVVFNAD
jgi:regulator of protease activity HflC (stomatin/prohibitin superfamily)